MLSASPAAAQWLFAPRVWPGPTWQAMRCHSKRAVTWERGDFGLRCAIHD